MSRSRPHRLAALAALSLPLIASQARPLGDEQGVRSLQGDGRAISARAFVDGLGVNAHVSWPGHYPYAETERVVRAMEYLGVRNLRDHINVSSLPVFERLASRGVRFTLLLNPKVGLGNYIDWAGRLQRTYPGSVAALEGPNEVDKWPVAYAGRTGLPAALATQEALYARAKADPDLAGVPVYNLTISGISRSTSDALGDLSAHADYANVHPYYRAGQQSWGHSRWDTRYTLPNYLASARWTAPGRPVVITETGSTSAPGASIGVTEEVQAKQILNSLFAAAKHGVAATYIYELVESHDAGPADVESHYGLYRHDWTPKPAAHALHSLTRIFRRRSGDAAAAATRAPAYSVTGAPASGASLLFSRGDGAYLIVLWAEPDLWDEAARRPIAAPASAARLTLGKDASVALYDPLVGDRPLRTWPATRSIEAPVSDHPLVIEVSPPRRGAREPKP